MLDGGQNLICPVRLTLDRNYSVQGQPKCTTTLKPPKRGAGAIFYAMLSLYDEAAERENVQLLRDAVATGAVKDPIARSILNSMVSVVRRVRRLSEAELHILVVMIQEKTSLRAAGNMAIRAALELVQQRGYRITPPKPIA